MIRLTPRELLQKAQEKGDVIGNPEIEERGLRFKGSDGIILPENPLPAWPELYIELDFTPVSGGGEEQRFIHFGQIDGPRLLFETRSYAGRWCLDVFVCSANGKSLVLMDKSKLHDENRRFTLRAELRRDNVKSFIDGKLEGEAELNFVPFSGNGFSLGVRQNRISFFSGIIGEIRIEDLSLRVG